MKGCIFCDIGKGIREREHVIFEDEKHIAFLDLYPTAKGQCMIVPKKHVGGLESFNLSDEDFSDLFIFVKKVAKKLERAMKPKFTFLAIEGTGVDHLHVKLYPVYKVKKMAEKRPIKPYRPYYGFFTTRLGPKAKEKELIKLAKKIPEG
jgi:diadenosine tetraphosphate (Ap4A) HIT family hydrolase